MPNDIFQATPKVMIDKSNQEDYPPMTSQAVTSTEHKAAALDAIDRHIVAEILEDGRITNVELARRSGISAPPCLRRLRRLEESGVILGYHAAVDGSKLGWPLTFFALIGLDSQRAVVLEAFEKEVASWDEVRECHMIRGGGDFLLRVVARDTIHQNELTKRLTQLLNVSRVQTLQTIRSSVSRAGVPL